MAPSSSLLFITPFIILSLFQTPAIAQLSSEQKGFISVSVSEKGLDFLKDLLIEKAISTLTPLSLPQIEKYVKIPVVGKVHIVLSNITIYHVDVNSSTINSDESGVSINALGATAYLSMNWEYSYKAWVIQVSDRGKASVQVEGMEVRLSVSLENQAGKLSMSLMESGCSIKDVDIHLDGGASWLYQGLVDAFSQKIESAVEDAILKKIKEGIVKVDSRLQSLPNKIPVDDVSSLNVTIVNGPSFSESLVDIGIDGLFVSRNNLLVSKVQHKGKASAFQKEPIKMVEISLHEDVFNSASSIYFNADYMRWTVNKLPDQSFLNTSKWKNIVPQLYKQFPDDNMNLNIWVTSPPFVDVSDEDVTTSIYSDVSLGVLDGGKELQVACISVVISASGYAEISRNNLTGSIGLDDISLSLKWSKIGDVQLELVQPVIEEVIETVLLPRLNTHLMRGFPLPLIHGFSLQNADIIYSESAITVSGNVVYIDSDISTLLLAIYGDHNLGFLKTTL